MDELLQLYKKIEELTAPICANGIGLCHQFHRFPQRCCHTKYCEAARKFAKEKYNIKLENTGHPFIPFMGKSGCVVPPHLRPQCALHACEINWGNVSEEMRNRYFPLRQQIVDEYTRQDKIPYFVTGAIHD